MNLFFIHTPFQLFVVNQIINYKHLEHNVAVLGFVQNNRHFYQLYEYMMEDGSFDYIYHFDDLENWALISLHSPLKSICRIVNNYKYLYKIIKKHHIRSLYLGDINNFSCKFSSYVFSRKMIEIVFYEEGSSHYCYQKHNFKMNMFLKNVLCSFYDSCFYLPIWGIKYAKWRFKKDIPFEKLHIDKRYSIINAFHEEYDEKLPISKKIPSKIRQVVLNDIKGLQNIDYNEMLLYISSPVYEEFGSEGVELFFTFLSEKLDLYSDKTIFVIKYHPRDTEQFKQRFQKELSKRSINYIVIGKFVNIPLEYYLQCFDFDKMITFLSSVSFYNGIIYKRAEIKDYALDYFMFCKSHGVKNVDLMLDLCKTLLDIKNIKQ